MKEILEFLDGKKAIILAIAGLIVGYLTQTNVIDGNLGALILAVLNVLAGGTAYATDKVLGARKRF